MCVGAAFGLIFCMAAREHVHFSPRLSRGLTVCVVMAFRGVGRGRVSGLGGVGGGIIAFFVALFLLYNRWHAPHVVPAVTLDSSSLVINDTLPM